jgi:hypothetical protein
MSRVDEISKEYIGAADELPMRPAEGRVGTCFCSAYTPYFAPSKNCDKSSGQLHPNVRFGLFISIIFRQQSNDLDSAS